MKTSTAALVSAPLAVPDPPEIVTFSINHIDYVGFSRPKVAALVEELQALLDEAIDVPNNIVARTKAIHPSSPVRSCSSSPDTGEGGDDVPPIVPADLTRPASHNGAKSQTSHLWPVKNKPLQVIKPPREDSIGAAALDAIKAAGEGGIDVAGIVAALTNVGRPIQSEDPEKAVTNAIYQALKPKGLIEAVPGSSRPTLWRCPK